MSNDNIKNLRIGVHVSPVINPLTFNQEITEQLKQGSYDIAVGIDKSKTAGVIKESWQGVRNLLGSKELTVPIDIDWASSSNVISQKLQAAVTNGIQSGLETFSKSDFSKFEQMMHKIASAQNELNKKTSNNEAGDKQSSEKQKVSKKSIDNLAASLLSLEKRFDDLRTKIETNALIILDQQMRDIASDTARTADSLGASYVKYVDILQKAKEISKIKSPNITSFGVNSSVDVKQPQNDVTISTLSTQTSQNSNIQNSISAKAIQEIEKISQKVQDEITKFVSAYESKTVLTDTQVTSLATHLHSILSPIETLVGALKTFGTAANSSVENTSSIEPSFYTKLNGSLSELGVSVFNLKEALLRFNPANSVEKSTGSLDVNLEPLIAKCDAIIGRIPGTPFTVTLDSKITNNLSVLFTVIGNLNRTATAIEQHCKTGTFKIAGAQGDGTPSSPSKRRSKSKEQLAKEKSDSSYLSSIDSQIQTNKRRLSNTTEIDFNHVDDRLKSDIQNAEEALINKFQEAQKAQGRLGDTLKEELNQLLNAYINVINDAAQQSMGGFKQNSSTANKVTRESTVSADKANASLKRLISERNRLVTDENVDPKELVALNRQIDELSESINNFIVARNKVVDTKNKQIIDTTYESKAAYDDEKKSLDALTKSTNDYYKSLANSKKTFNDATKFMREYERNSVFASDPTAASLMGQIQGILPAGTHYYDLGADELERLIALVPRYKKATETIRRENNATADGSVKTAGKVADLGHKIKQYIDTNTKLKKDPALYNSFMQLYEATKDGTQNFTQLNTKFKEYQREAQAAGLESDSLFVKMKKLFHTHFSSGIAVEAVQFLRRGFTEVFQAVKLVDDQMTELKKVTDLSDTGYKEYLSDAADQAKRLGSTLDAVIESSATWARLGYDMSDVGYLSEAATVYVNVADGLESATEGTETLISTMKAFNVEAKNAIDVVDALNITGNTAAISSAGLGQALTRSSAALSAANNSLEESIGLITAGM